MAGQASKETGGCAQAGYNNLLHGAGSRYERVVRSFHSEKRVHSSIHPRCVIPAYSVISHSEGEIPSTRHAQYEVLIPAERLDRARSRESPGGVGN